MKVGLGQTIIIDDIKMRCTGIRTDFCGDHYLLAFFQQGDLKTLEFAANELDAFDAKLISKEEPKMEETK